MLHLLFLYILSHVIPETKALLSHIIAGNRVGKISVLSQRDFFTDSQRKQAKHIYVQQKLKIHCPYTQASTFIPPTQQPNACACPDTHCARLWFCIVTFSPHKGIEQKGSSVMRFRQISIHVACPRCAESVPFSASSHSHCSNQGY